MNPGPKAPEGTVSHLNTQEDANGAMAEYLASERSAVAKLGWDPGLSITTEPTPEKTPTGGTYQPKYDTYWYRQDALAAGLHEPMHRGIERLRQAGLINVPKGSEEEAIVRALMQRAYGDIEAKDDLKPGRIYLKSSPGYKQLEEGRRRANDPIIDELEKAAAEEVARRHPRGPR